GEPLGAQGRAADGSWLIDLSSSLPVTGILQPGQSSNGRTVTVRTPNHHPIAFDAGVSGVLAGNNPPVFSSIPPNAAAVGQAFAYQAAASDLDGDSLSYLLVRAPTGMTVDSTTGLVTWTPTAASPGQTTA